MNRVCVTGRQYYANCNVDFLSRQDRHTSYPWHKMTMVPFSMTLHDP